MTIAELATRYSITEASAKARVKYLNLNLETIDEKELEQLDSLNDHLEAGKTIATFNFTPTAEVEVMAEEGSEMIKVDSSPSHDLAPPMAAAIPIEMNQMEALERTYGFLQKASENNWHLPTSIVRSITGATPRGKRWKRYGFVFEAATKHGQETAWAVSAAEWDFPGI